MLLLEPGQSAWFYLLTVLTVKLMVRTNENAALLTDDIIGDQQMRALLTKLHDLLQALEQT